MSGKRFTLLDAVTDFDTANSRISANQDSNFELCFICQEPPEERLLCPATNSTHTDKSTGYLTLVQQLKQFEAIGELPVNISSRINNLSCNNLLQRLVRQKVKFHKKCKNKYNKQHYDRASKKRKIFSENISETALPPSTRVRYTAQNFQPKCFFVIKKTQLKI